MNTILKTLFSNLEPTIIILGVVFAGLWIVMRDPIGRLLDRMGGNGAKAGSALWPIGITIASIVVAMIVAMPETFKELVAPSIRVANVEAAGFEASQTTSEVFTARKERDVAAFKAEAAKDNARARAFDGTIADPAQALEPAAQVAVREWNDATDPNATPQSMTTEKTTTVIEYDREWNSSTNSYELVEKGQTVTKKETERKVSPGLMTGLILGLVVALIAIFGSRGGKS